MATTNFREDFLGRDLTAPTTNALDFLGRPVTATADGSGRPLRRLLRPVSTAVTLDQELQTAAGVKYIVTVAGTTGASDPTAPAVGATVVNGTATFLREK
jgi:hypothetical protein